MRKHPRALEAEGITPERYAELRAVCRQYPGHVRYLRLVRSGLEERPERRRGRSGVWKKPDPTGNAAAYVADRTAWESSRVQLIEGCARAVAVAAVVPALIECVTEERGYDILRHRPPCGRQAFYRTRLLFFILLDARLRAM